MVALGSGRPAIDDMCTVPGGNGADGHARAPALALALTVP